MDSLLGLPKPGSFDGLPTSIDRSDRLDQFNSSPANVKDKGANKHKRATETARRAGVKAHRKPHSKVVLGTEAPCLPYRSHPYSGLCQK